MGEIFAGRYELVDPIGRGGVGAVWRVWDHRRRRYVAAKVLQQRDAHTLLRFVREQALRIDHPHVLAPASWAADDDKVLFTMDLVGGGSFAHLIGDYGPLPPRYVCTLLDQLLSGLAAVHAENVVHRDIKPANILLEATGTGRPHVRLSDFGIALTKGEPRLTEANYVMGTPGYFAPEQMMGEDPDFPADLFAVGLVTLYLLQRAQAGRGGARQALRAGGAERSHRGARTAVAGGRGSAAAGPRGPVPHRHGSAEGAGDGGRPAARGRSGRRGHRGLRPSRTAARRLRPQRPHPAGPSACEDRPAPGSRSGTVPASAVRRSAAFSAIRRSGALAAVRRGGTSSAGRRGVARSAVRPAAAVHVRYRELHPPAAAPPQRPAANTTCRGPFRSEPAPRASVRPRPARPRSVRSEPAHRNPVRPRPARARSVRSEPAHRDPALSTSRPARRAPAHPGAAEPDATSPDPTTAAREPTDTDAPATGRPARAPAPVGPAAVDAPSAGPADPLDRGPAPTGPSAARAPSAPRTTAPTLRTTGAARAPAYAHPRFRSDSHTHADADSDPGAAPA
ncbi:hypothetical protein JOF35_000972 [Streptomyces demainii]|uniref:Protein kinase domain-containing protein n=1 Tax=Streptomyces demainii TaxID=588122 RepID=A0ABT9KJW2_9ACTN|nr:hypothetical protein [Streptomyces demainii]